MKSKTQHVRIKFPQGIKHKVREWCKAFIKQEETILTDNRQNAFVESVYLDEQPDALYLIFGLKAKTIYQANSFLARVNTSINDFSQKYLSDPNRKAFNMISYLRKDKEG